MKYDTLQQVTNYITEHVERLETEEQIYTLREFFGLEVNEDMGAIKIEQLLFDTLQSCDAVDLIALHGALAGEEYYLDVDGDTVKPVDETPLRKKHPFEELA